MFRHLPLLWIRLGMAVAMGLALFSPLASASAQTDSASSTAAAARNGRILGIHPAQGVVPSTAPTLGSGKLTYHGGPVEHTNTVYAIYWIPAGFTVSSNYTTLINRFFGDVSAASGKTSNVYYSDTQYSDTTGTIQYQSTFAGSTTDTDPLPISGCVDKSTTVCVTDAQIQAEVLNVIARQGWTPSSTTEFFMFTAKGVGSCFDSTNTQCSYTYYCAYHSWVGSGTSALLYANQPYAASPSGCSTGNAPNGDDADATINVTSHEHNETITDEQGDAWYDAAGYEDGDKCAWIFGRELGTTGKKYNQAINGHHYLLQEEWSNATNRCVQQGT